MLRLCRLVLLFILVFGASVARAALPCVQQNLGPPLWGSTMFGFEPANPDSSQSVTFTVGYLYASSTAATATLQGNTIDVTVNELWELTFTPPPISCQTVTIGPLPVGVYTVRMFGSYDDRTARPPVLLRTTTLEVVPRPATIEVPAFRAPPWLRLPCC